MKHIKQFPQLFNNKFYQNITQRIGRQTFFYKFYGNKKDGVETIVYGFYFRLIDIIQAEIDG